MPILTTDEAKIHLRLEFDYPDEQLAGKVAAAELRAAHFLNRAIFADAAALAAAVNNVPVSLVAAGVSYRAAIDAADAQTDAVARSMLRESAERGYEHAQDAARETLAGIVVTDDIRAAILLIVGHLFENVADSEERDIKLIPNGAQYLLLPYRIGWGC